MVPLDRAALQIVEQIAAAVDIVRRVIEAATVSSLCTDVVKNVAADLHKPCGVVDMDGSAIRESIGIRRPCIVPVERENPSYYQKLETEYLSEFSLNSGTLCAGGGVEQYTAGYMMFFRMMLGAQPSWQSRFRRPFCVPPENSLCSTTAGD